MRDTSSTVKGPTELLGEAAELAAMAFTNKANVCTHAGIYNLALPVFQKLIELQSKLEAISVTPFTCPCGFKGGPRNIRRHRMNCSQWSQAWRAKINPPACESHPNARHNDQGCVSCLLGWPADEAPSVLERTDEQPVSLLSKESVPSLSEPKESEEWKQRQAWRRYVAVVGLGDPCDGNLSGERRAFKHGWEARAVL